MRGPVTVEAHGTQIAIGYGMASKILVEPVDDCINEQPNRNNEDKQGSGKA